MKSLAIINRSIIYPVLFYGAGIAAGEASSLSPAPFSWLCFFAFIILGLAVYFFKRPRWFGILLLVVFLFLGMIRAQSYSILNKNNIKRIVKYYRKKPIRIKGHIITDVEKKKVFNRYKTTFTLNVDEVESPWGWQKHTGKVLVHLFRDISLSYGDCVVLEGKLHAPYNFSSDSRFSYRDYLYRRGISYILSVKKKAPIKIVARNKGNFIKRAMFALRNKFKNILSDNLSENEAGIMKAILLGDRSQIPQHVKDLFVHTGTAHVLAISGLHVGIVAALFFVLLKLFPFKMGMRYALTVVLLVGFVLISGARPSVVRASIMTGVFLMGFVVEREANTLNSLFLAALIILLGNPLALFDVGFQLSFLSVLSIILFYPIILKGVSCIFQGVTIVSPNYFVRFFSISLSAWIGVLGLILYYFNIVTPVSIVGNFFVIPLITILVGLGLGLMLTGIILPAAAIVFAPCIKVLLNMMVGGVFLLSRVPLAYFILKDISIWVVIIYYVFVFSIFYCVYRRIRPL